MRFARLLIVTVQRAITATEPACGGPDEARPALDLVCAPQLAFADERHRRLAHVEAAR